MNVMRSFTLKSLKRNKKRTVVTIIGVIISAAMITAVTVFFSSFLTLIQKDTEMSVGRWHAQIQDVAAQNLQIITQSGKADDVTLSRDLGSAILSGSENDQKPYLFVRQYSAEGFDQMSVRLLEGRLPENSGEVVISETVDTMADVQYKIGGTLDLELGQRVLKSGESAGEPVEQNSSLNYEMTDDEKQILVEDFLPGAAQSFTIVGVMERPTFEYSWSAGCGVLGYLDESTLAPSDTVDVFLTAVHLNRNIYKEITALALTAGVSAENVEFNNDLLRYNGVVVEDNVYSFMMGFMLVIIIIIMAASISLIYNAFSISVSERSKQLGLLASVGATKQQKRTAVYFEGFIIGLIGIPLGILAGIGGMAITLAAIQPLFDSFIHLTTGLTLSLVVPPAAVAVTVLFSALTIFVSVYKPAKRASKIMPIDAIRLSQEIKLTRKAVKTSRLTRSIFGFEAEIALKNLKRSRKKYRATIVSLVISLVLFLTVSTYADLTDTISSATYDGYNFDIAVTYSSLSDTETAHTNEKIASLDLVTGMTEVSRIYGYSSLSDSQLGEYAKMYTGGSDNGSSNYFFDMLCLDAASFSAYAKAAGVNANDFEDPASPKAILINHAQDYYAAEGENLKKISGDILNIRAGETLSFNAGDLPEDTAQSAVTAPVTLTLGAVTEQRPMGTLMQNFTQATLVVSQAVFDSIAQGLSEDQKNAYISHAAYVTTDDDQRLEKQLTELTQALPADSIFLFNIQSATRSEKNLSTFLGVFVYGFIILISLICIANIFNTVSTNIALRRKEFAMLRSVGMTPKGFNKMIRFESIFYGLKGLLYGLPISVAVAFLLHGIQLSVLESSFTLPWVSYGFGILMILVIVFATMLYSTHRIKRENIIDALKEENL